MSEEKQHSEVRDRKQRNPLLLVLLAGGSFVLFLMLIFYLGERLETIEDQLRFSQPAPGQITVPNSFSIDTADGQTVYVPVYSHIYSRGGEPFLLEATLSIRNTDPHRPITIESVQYYDTKGNMVQAYLSNPMQLAPLETTAFLVEKQDTRGGSGANFIVKWTAKESVYEPIIEAVMIGLSGGNSISFTSAGRPLVERMK